MKIKVGDLVVPRHQLGKVVKVDAREVAFEITSSTGVKRITKITEEMAHLRGETLEQLVNTAVIVVGRPIRPAELTKEELEEVKKIEEEDNRK